MGKVVTQNRRAGERQGPVLTENKRAGELSIAGYRSDLEGGRIE